MSSHFFVKLLPPRPTFPQDITPEETHIMHEHAAYWTALMDEGHVQVFGPVLDPEGAFGMGVVSAENEAEVEKLLADDPALKLRMTHKVSPMRAILPTTS